MKIAFDREQWSGRIDALEGERGRRWHQIVVPAEQTAVDAVVLTGFACDAGVARNKGRVGAARGPAAIRTALANLPVHECTALADAGDVTCEGDALEAAQAELASTLTQQLARGQFPIVLGGGHEVAFASFVGLAQHLVKQKDKPRIGIVNFDAHFDLRRAERANSGTPFLQIAQNCETRGWLFRYCCLGVARHANTGALFDRAGELGVVWMLDEDLTLDRLQAARETLALFMASVDHLYLTVCLDALPASDAPGVSAPAARGIGLDVVEPLVNDVIASGKLALADLAEMNPRFDIDGRTARVAARLVARIANGIARHR